MSVYAISDLHLSFAANKPMNIFRGWENHTERIKANWKRLVNENDTVVLPGDFSWALKLEDTLEDFKFLESLPGTKIIGKGNHDLWWGTRKKIEDFFKINDIKTVKLLFNNAYKVENSVICGTRGWFYDCSAEDTKVLMREVGRLKASLSEAKKLGGEIKLFLHYPPVYGEYVCREMLDVIKEFGIDTVYHGHIHGAGFNHAVKEFEGVKFKLISCDCVDFTPVLIEK